MPDEKALEEAMTLMEQAMKVLGPSEQQVLRQTKLEVDEAAKQGGAGFDKRLEFCYAIKFSKDKLPNARLQKAVDSYIQAAEAE